MGQSLFGRGTWEWPDQLVRRDRKENQEAKVLLDLVELKANRVKKDHLVYLVTLDREVTQVHVPSQAEAVHPDHLDLLDFLVSRAIKENKEQMVNQVKEEKRVTEDQEDPTDPPLVQFCVEIYFKFQGV